MRKMNIFMMTIAMMWVAISNITLAKSSSNDEAILKYNYGNQITRSVLEIYSSGKLEVNEFTCCPPNTLEKHESSNLTDEELKTLTDAIDSASKVKLKTVDGNPTLLGSSSGQLISILDSSVVAPIRLIERGERDERDRVTYNPSSAARWIEDLVLQRVNHKMYR